MKFRLFHGWEQIQFIAVMYGYNVREAKRIRNEQAKRSEGQGVNNRRAKSRIHNECEEPRVIK